jgi:hypothetical protein
LNTTMKIRRGSDTVGIGIEKNLFLGTIQIHRSDSKDTPEEFQAFVPSWQWLDMLTITKITAHRRKVRRRTKGKAKEGKWQNSVQ